ncbi:MAG TPA: nucleotidyltransferase family protein [Myxococcota bacterium]|nr:nucleotidyltransferase family protein [Myxococcota bacterium]
MESPSSDGARDPSGPRRVVVLAGRREGPDALAAAAGAPHRALIEIEGEPMLLRVVKRLLEWPSIDEVRVSIDAPDRLEALPAFARLGAAGRTLVERSTDSPSASVLESLDRAGLDAGPVLVTTADHALLDEAILEAFLAESARSEADLTIGLVSRATIEARFPNARRTYLRFRDDAYSGANLFLFRRPAARRAVEFWRRIESERKHPWRLARAFGWLNLALFLSRRLSLEDAMRRASDVVGARVEAIRIPIAEAAVDVDKIEDLELVRDLLARRRTRSAGA